MEPEALLRLYGALLDAYGPQGWWPAEDPWEIIVGAVLTQRAPWSGVEKAICALKERNLMAPGRMLEAEDVELSAALRAAIFHRAKAATLKRVASWLEARWRGSVESMLEQPTEALRRELLSIHGIGPETADAILLYAAHRPVFVTDAYARRLFVRLGWWPQDGTLAKLRSSLMEAFPAEAELRGEFHALIVCHGKRFCRTQPRCELCPTLRFCSLGALRVREASS